MFWAKQLNDSNEWNKFATALLFSLNIDYGKRNSIIGDFIKGFRLAIKVFREIAHPGMVMALEEIKVNKKVRGVSEKIKVFFFL